MAKLIRIESGNNSFDIGDNIKEFAYDGCHKIYLIENDSDRAEMVELGYDQILPIDKLFETFIESCDLRFINTVQLESVVPQFEDAKFIYDDGAYDETDFYVEEDEDEEYIDEEEQYNY